MVHPSLSIGCSHATTCRSIFRLETKVQRHSSRKCAISLWIQDCYSLRLFQNHCAQIYKCLPREHILHLEVYNPRGQLRTALQ